MAGALRLAIIGDPHLAVPRGDDDARIECDPGFKLHGQSLLLLSSAIAAVNAEPDIDAVLLLGDMTRDGELFNHEAAAELLSELQPPLYILAGNHDYLRNRRAEVIYPDSPRLDAAEFRDFWSARGFPQGRSDYKAELPGGVDLIALDSNATLDELRELGWDERHQDYGYVSLAQLAWLDRELGATRAAGRTPLLALHHTLLPQSPAERTGHPLVEVFGFWQVRHGEGVRALLAKHRVPLVLSGHLHIQSVNAISGSGGPQLTNLACAALVSYPHTWGVLTVADGALSYESRSLADVLPAGFIESSRAGSGEGFKQLVLRELRAHPLLGPHAEGIAEMVAASEWWPRLADGTLAGFRVDPALLPRSPLQRLAYAKVAELLNEYGTWKTERGDPKKVVIGL